MNELKDYEEYKSLFKDDLVVFVRNLLERLENVGDFDLEDSNEHNDLVEYFNEFYLHKKLSRKEWEKRK